MEELAFALDTFYAVMAGALVMFMAAGFTMLESGLVRAKNTTEILTKNIALYSSTLKASLSHHCYWYSTFGTSAILYGNCWTIFRAGVTKGDYIILDYMYVYNLLHCRRCI